MACLAGTVSSAALSDGPDLISAGECSDDGGGSINFALNSVPKSYFVRPIKNERTRLKVQQRMRVYVLPVSEELHYELLRTKIRESEFS